MNALALGLCDNRYAADAGKCAPFTLVGRVSQLVPRTPFRLDQRVFSLHHVDIRLRRAAISRVDSIHRSWLMAKFTSLSKQIVVFGLLPGTRATE
jgi:hypothetical protein